MIYWCKRISFITGCFGFIIIFLAGLNPETILNISLLLNALLKGILGGVLLWFSGFVICDIVLKGIIEDIPETDLDSMEGGLEQRVLDNKVKPKVEDLALHQKGANSAAGKKKGLTAASSQSKKNGA